MPFPDIAVYNELNILRIPVPWGGGPAGGYANKAAPKTLNRATGVVLVVLGAVVLLFKLVG